MLCFEICKGIFINYNHVKDSCIHHCLFPTERLWSPREFTSGKHARVTALKRLQYFRCLLNRRGVAAAPVTNYYARTPPDGPGSCLVQ